MAEVTALGALLVALGGGVGSIARFSLDTWVTRRTRRRVGDAGGAPFPWGIVLVNLSGSLLLGLLVGLLRAPELQAPGLLDALGVGVLGGYTTLSTASLDTVRLARSGRFAAAAAHALCTLGVAVLLAIAGILLGASIG